MIGQVCIVIFRFQGGGASADSGGGASASCGVSVTGRGGAAEGVESGGVVSVVVVVGRRGGILLKN